MDWRLKTNIKEAVSGQKRERRSKKQSESTIEIAFLKTLLIFDPTLPFKYLEILKEEKEYMVL